MRELWWLARAAWQQTALLASITAMPEEDGESFVPDDFNPFYAGRERDRNANLAPYDPQHLKRLQESFR